MFSSNVNWFCPQKGWKLLPASVLNECRYTEKVKKVIRYITDNLKFSSDDSCESDEE